MTHPKHLQRAVHGCLTLQFRYLSCPFPSPILSSPSLISRIQRLLPLLINLLRLFLSRLARILHDLLVRLRPLLPHVRPTHRLSVAAHADGLRRAGGVLSRRALLASGLLDALFAGAVGLWLRDVSCGAGRGLAGCGGLVFGVEVGTLV